MPDPDANKDTTRPTFTISRASDVRKRLNLIGGMMRDLSVETNETILVWRASHSDELCHCVVREGDTLLGRRTTNDVSIPVTSVSRQHAKIVKRGGVFNSLT